MSTLQGTLGVSASAQALSFNGAALASVVTLGSAGIGHLDTVLLTLPSPVLSYVMISVPSRFAGPSGSPLLTHVSVTTTIFFLRSLIAAMAQTAVSELALSFLGNVASDTATLGALGVHNFDFLYVIENPYYGNIATRSTSTVSAAFLPPSPPMPPSPPPTPPPPLPPPPSPLPTPPPSPPPPPPPPLPPPPSPLPPPPRCQLCMAPGARLLDAVHMENACVKRESGVTVCRPPGHWGCPADHFACPSGATCSGYTCPGGGPNFNHADGPTTGTSRPCSDALSTRRCTRKLNKGKCRKNRVRTVKCRFSCGSC